MKTRQAVNYHNSSVVMAMMMMEKEEGGKQQYLYLEIGRIQLNNNETTAKLQTSGFWAVLVVYSTGLPTKIVSLSVKIYVGML